MRCWHGSSPVNDCVFGQDEAASVCAADGWQFNTVYVDTDAAGQFGFRIFRVAWPTNGVGSDTVALWIRATVKPTLPQTVATIFDSVLVRVVIAPIGQAPTPGSVRIVLPVP